MVGVNGDGFGNFDGMVCWVMFYLGIYGFGLEMLLRDFCLVDVVLMVLMLWMVVMIGEIWMLNGSMLLEDDECVFVGYVVVGGVVNDLML